MTDKGRRIINMIMAVIVSITGWVFVVYNYETMTEKRYSNVPVSFTGEEELADRGLAVSEASNETIAVTLNQKRIETARLSADDIKITADLSNCVAGDNSVPLTISGPDGTNVVSVDESSIAVSVGRAKTESMDIEVIYSEGAEPEAVPLAFDLSRAVADVYCTSDRLSSIAKVAAVLDYSEVTDDVKSFTANLVALDEEGNTLQHVVISPDEISLDASAGFKKTVRLSVPVQNEDDENYERKYTVPDTVVIKGSKDAIEDIAVVQAVEINLNNYYESQEISLEYDLPDGIYIADESAGQVLKLTVTEIETTDEEEEESTE